MFYFVRETFLFIMANLFDITLATIAWLLLQLPVITGPGATVAIYHFARQALLQDEALFKDFIQGLRQYFWKSWLIVLPYILVILLLVYDTAFFLAVGQSQIRLLASIPMAVFSFLLLTQTYVFVFFVRENGALWASIKKAFLLAVSEMPFTIGLMLFTFLYLMGLYVTRIGLAILFVGPVAILQSKAVQYLLAKRGI
ncbi:MAG: DUF624 domain-containing protein, partial [Chloroflexi bacterium]|nr:DUF624 domain-containing protein [Chloroflexota bacterium]